jgi:hypothetical protein
MAATASPFGLKPVQLIGGQTFNGGVIREFKLPSNVAAAYYTGAVIYMNTNGVPTPISATPVAPKYTATSADGTAGILGVCVGVRFVNPATNQPLYSQTLPSGAITAGYTDVYIRVCDDPDQLYSIQAATVIGSKTNGALGAIGQNAALTGFSGSATTGLANTALDTGSNWGSCASTTTLAMRIVDIITPNDAYPEVLVKFNHGVHSYVNPLGV